MSKELEKLKSIGAQKIHELTHISREHVQAVLHGTFDGLNKIQFLGFISILEREYKLNLNELRAKGLVHFKDYASSHTTIKSNVFSTKKKKYSTFSYTLLTLLILGFLFYFELIPTLGTTTQAPKQVNNELIENAQKNIDVTTIDTNETNKTQSVAAIATDINISDVNSSIVVAPEETVTQKAPTVVKSIKIMPKIKVWVGYIDIKENKKYQKTFSDALTLDAKKDWLLLFGHGNLDIDVNGKVEEFRTTQILRFKYIDGQLTQITISEFKEINKDSQW